MKNKNWKVPRNNIPDRFLNKDTIITNNDEQVCFTLPVNVQEQIKNLGEGESATFTFEIPLNDDLTT